ncbi:hypothetical protein D3C85_1250580 [compost metagenome]
MRACQRIGFQQALEAAFIHDGAATFARMRPNVDDMIRHLDHIGIMLDDNDSVALVAQLLQQPI